MSSVQ